MGHPGILGGSGFRGLKAPAPSVESRRPIRLGQGGAAMIALEKLTDEEFERHALGELSKALGPYGVARFLSTYRTGTGDYTRDRHKWLDGVTMEEILKESQSRA